MTISFEQFKSAVIADMGGRWKSDMIHGFRDFDAEGKGGKGFQWSVPASFCNYAYRDGKWAVCAGRAVVGSGETLEEAHRDEEALYDAGFDAIES